MDGCGDGGALKYNWFYCMRMADFFIAFTVNASNNYSLALRAAL